MEDGLMDQMGKCLLHKQLHKTQNNGSPGLQSRAEQVRQADP